MIMAIRDIIQSIVLWTYHDLSICETLSLSASWIEFGWGPKQCCSHPSHKKEMFHAESLSSLVELFIFLSIPWVIYTYIELYNVIYIYIYMPPKVSVHDHMTIYIYKIIKVIPSYIIIQIHLFFLAYEDRFMRMYYVYIYIYTCAIGCPPIINWSTSLPQ